MRVLVTGGSGFIGRHIVTRLLAKGDDVSVVDLLAYPDPEVQCVVGDLRDPSVVERAIPEGLDGVIHLAALTSVLQSVKDPEAVFATNALATHYLLERCRLAGVGRFVLASTNAVVGDIGRNAIDELAPLRPLTPYGATKAAGEMLMSAYSASYGITTVALRFTNIYGRGMQVKDSVVARLMRAALAGGGIQIYGDGEQVRDYLYVTDAARSLEMGLSLDESNVLTIGNGHSFSMNEVHSMACDATGVAIGKEHIAGKPGEMPAVIVNIDKARSVGFVPEYSLAAGLAETWADFTSDS